jgi:uncharacterized phage protein (TIGR02218 family)
MELRGFCDDLGIAVADVYGGKFDGASVEIRLIPWMNEESEEVVIIGGGILGAAEQDGIKFKIESLSFSAYLQQTSLLQTYTPNCRFMLGDSRCTVDVGYMAVAGIVTEISDPAVESGATVRRWFRDVSRDEADGYFDEGLIAWVTGENAGQSSKVKAYTLLNGEITLWEPLIYPIAIGDVYTMQPGCDKTKETCKNKFDNFINFGGFPTIPGTDATSQTPMAHDS